ncbi:MAG: terminase family protein [Pseudomonadota bacterium]
MSTQKLRELFLNELTDDEIVRLKFDWPLWARLKQRPPLNNWRTWLVLGGRGAGKTRTGAEWLKGVALGDPHYPGSSGGRVALVGTNYDDIRDVMIEGESGLLAVSHKSERPQWLVSKRELVWPNGTIGKLFSSADPEGLRGSQFGAVWLDEVVKWHKLEQTWDMLQFCLRIGKYPRQVVTTTPKPLKLLQRILDDPMTVAVRSTTRENMHNLSGSFLDYVEGIYAGTSLGRQELDGEIIADNEHGLWSRAMIEAGREDEAPAMGRIVIAVDPPAGSGEKSACCGIIAAGKADDDTCHVLADRTLASAKPHEWAGAVVRLYHMLEADLVVAEANQGGEMVRSVLHTEDKSIPVRTVHARRSKWLRAEPVAMLYEQGRVRHAGRFPELEDQMCAIGVDGLANGVSPDRVDALVWAISELALQTRGQPRVRKL